MPRLSILIPADGGAERLERTLVSVLQNRPEACEVIVVTRGAYDDPYNLADEVSFVSAPHSVRAIEQIQQGLRHCHAPVVHVLHAGLEATDRWTDAAVAHFDKASIAAVAPLVVNARDPRRVVSAGLDYRASGRMIVRTAGEPVDGLAGGSQPIVGPTLAAAFYRLEALTRASDEFTAGLSTELAQVDWALVLRRMGYAARFEPASRVLGEADPPEGIAKSRHAWQAERLFWRHAGTLGWARSLAAHATLLVTESLGNWRAPQVAVSRLAGAVVGCAGAIAGRKPAIRTSSARMTTIEEVALDPLATPHSASPRVMLRTDAGNPATPAPRRETLEHAGHKTGRNV